MSELMGFRDPLLWRYISRLYLKATLYNTYQSLFDYFLPAALNTRRMKLILQLAIPKSLYQLIDEAIRPLALGTATLIPDYRSIEVPLVPPDIPLKNNQFAYPHADPAFERNGFPFYPMVMHSLEALWRGTPFLARDTPVHLVLAPFGAVVKTRTLRVEPDRDTAIMEYGLDPTKMDVRSVFFVPNGKERYVCESLHDLPDRGDVRYLAHHAVCGLVFYDDEVPEDIPFGNTAQQERLNQEYLVFDPGMEWLANHPVTRRVSRPTRDLISQYLRSLNEHSDYSRLPSSVSIQTLLNRIGVHVDDVQFPGLGASPSDSTGATASGETAGISARPRRKARRIERDVRARANTNTYGVSIVSGEHISEASGPGGTVEETVPPIGAGRNTSTAKGSGKGKGKK